jgi:sulfhydrogenase subunit beta (sulfur reductase)
MKVIDTNGFAEMIEHLREAGYTVIAPVLRDGAIIYDEIAAIGDLPVGWTDEQEAGSYAVKKRNDDALFGYVVGPHSWKKFLFPPKLKLWQAKRKNKGFEIEENTDDIPKYAFIGVRSCELNAIAIQDKVFEDGSFRDPYYQKVREKLFIVAVNCTQAGKTCFCVSMNTGPRAKSGYDISLTEVIDQQDHYFLLHQLSPKGEELASRIAARDASPVEIQRADAAVKNAESNMGRQMNTEGIKDLLYNNHEHPQWSEVAARCLTCANCTLVCPTCFCSTVEDITDLRGEHTERWRRWDSCFTLDFSKVAGGNFRSSPMSRYRQWMTHKLASWFDQFGTSGCVGCGRCITWCPVGIDITQEVQKIRNSTLTKL